MDILPFITEYKAVLSGTVIGAATITGVSLNILYNKTLDKQFKREKNASTASAIAAEILCNSNHLRDLHMEVENYQSENSDISEHKHLDTQVYQELLSQIGELGSAITFMVVDTYDDIKKRKGRIEGFTAKNEILQRKEDILNNIQKTLAKTLAASLTLYIYSDYMSGRKWMKHVKEQRILRIERSLDDFCTFLEQSNNSLEFVGLNQQEDLEFRKRFTNKADRKNIKELFIFIRETLDQLPSQPTWRAQLILRGLSYKIQNTLSHLSDIATDEYDLMSEQGYTRFL